MAFFPRQFYNNHPTASFTPLFRLLDDFDSYSRQDGRSQCRRAGLTQWQPKFDVREVGDAYELHGELPGVDKQNVQIEFTEPQTLVVRGKTERSYSAGTSPTAAAAVEDAAMSNDSTEEKPKNDHQATVEDEAEFEEIEKPQEQQETAVEATENKTEPAPAADKAKYWLTERSVGEFTRTFSFPARVDQDAVSASFNNGILSISVPKAKKHESRRITVN